MRKVLLMGLFTLIFSPQIFSQDFHFSQFYSNPQLLNPASTGAFNEDFRVTTQHREQWSQINSIFKTSTFGAEFNLREGKLKQGKIGIGGQVYLDNESEVFKSQGFRLSAAYHQTLGHRHRHHVSLGFQPEYLQESLEKSTLTFGNQYQNYQYNSQLSHNESLGAYRQSSVVGHLGVKYQYDLSKRSTIAFGFASHQLFAFEVLGSDMEIKGMKYVTHLSSYHWLSDRISLSPLLVYMNQKGAYNLIFGTLSNYTLSYGLDLDLVLGAMYRWDDAIIGALGMSYKNITAQVTYDLTLSELRGLEEERVMGYNMLGAWEVSITFKGVFNKHNYSNQYHMRCTIL